MNDREREFFEKHQAETGHTMIDQPATFRFPIDGVWHKFTPDFYCPDCETFFEVSGSRQAFHEDKFKLRAVRVYFPSIKMEVVASSGKAYRSLNGLDYRNRKTLPASYEKGRIGRPHYAYRMASVERLKAVVADSRENLVVASQATLIPPYSLVKYIRDGMLPNKTSADAIHRYCDSITTQQLVAS